MFVAQVSQVIINILRAVEFYAGVDNN